jgi:hypothetical protein
VRVVGFKERKKCELDKYEEKEDEEEENITTNKVYQYQ